MATATTSAPAPEVAAAPSATGTATSAAPKTDAKAKTQPEAKVHPALEALIKSYDTTVQKAESYYVEIIETVQRDKISRADVVATLMRARGISFETAQSQYSRMKGIWQNPEVLRQLKSGEITLRVAREKTTKKQQSPANGTATPGSGDAAGAAAATAQKDKETKEARYDRCRKSHVAAVKECGFDLKSALMSFEADLKSAGVK